jgi:hypothetical protein
VPQKTHVVNSVPSLPPSINEVGVGANGGKRSAGVLGVDSGESSASELKAGRYRKKKVPMSLRTMASRGECASRLKAVSKVSMVAKGSSLR